MPILCSMFYSIRRAYRFGFSKPGFPVKCLREICEIGVALVVPGRERVGVVPKKRCSFFVAGEMCLGKGSGTSSLPVVASRVGSTVRIVIIRLNGNH